MTTTELIELLKNVEKGASGRSREISFYCRDKYGETIFISTPQISFSSSGDGVAGAELSLLIEQ